MNVGETRTPVADLIGEKIRSGWSAGDVARACGVPVDQIRDAQRGRATPMIEARIRTGLAPQPHERVRMDPLAVAGDDLANAVRDAFALLPEAPVDHRHILGTPEICNLITSDDHAVRARAAVGAALADWWTARMEHG